MTTDITFSAGDSNGNAKQGCPENFYVTFLNGVTTCYVSLSCNGVEETAYSRATVTTAYQWVMLIPQSYGTNNYTVVAYDASTGGNVIGTSASFDVEQSIIPTVGNGGLPLPGGSKCVIIGDSTLAQCYTQVPASYDYASSYENRWAGLWPALMGYPVNVDIWPNYHVLSPTNPDRYAGGGAIYGVSGDATEPIGTTPGASATPGFITRFYSLLLLRPQIVIFVVTANDPGNGIATATTIANYEMMANAFLLSGCIVLFQLMRPSGLVTSGNRNDRVTDNVALYNFANSTAGCYWWDLSPVYTTTPGGIPSSYNDSSAVLDGTLTVGLHPTPQGGIAEANSFIARVNALGLFDTSYNGATEIYDNAEGYTSYTTAPNFNSGNNAGVTLTNGASGTWLTGISAVAGPGAAKSTIVGSTEANATTGGYSQVMTLTPGDTGAQIMTITMEPCFTRSTPYAGSELNVQSMMEIEITTDSENFINCLCLSFEGYFGSPLHDYFRNGTIGMTSSTSNTPLPLSGAQTWWMRCQLRMDKWLSLLESRLIINVDATSRTAAATVKIKRHYEREYPVDSRLNWYLPGRPTISQNGASYSSNTPIIVNLPTDGTAANGIRWWYRTASANTGWTYGGDIILNPSVAQYSFVVPGLTAGTAYDFRISALRYAGVLGAGYGIYHAEGETSNYIRITPSSASAVGAIGSIMVIT